MVDWRQVWTWLFLGTLCCLVVLSVSPPRLWDESSQIVDCPALESRAADDVSEVRPSQESVAQVVVASSDRLSSGPSLENPPREERQESPQGNKDVESTAGLSYARDVKWMFEEPRDASSPEVEVLAALPMPSTSPEPVTPADKIGIQQIETLKEEPAPERSDAERPPLPTDVERLPLVVAHAPSPARTLPHEDVQSPAEMFYYPHTDPPNSQSKMTESRPVEGRVEGVWREPEVLLESLKTLAAAKSTEPWAGDVVREIRALGAAMPKDAGRARAILDRIAELNRRAPQLAATVAERDRALARKMKKANFALSRRLDVWRAVVELAASRSNGNAMPETDPHRLAMCVADVDALIGDSAEGRAWRQYLLVDVLRQSAQQPAIEDRATRQLAQEVLGRIAETPLTPYQRKFVSSGPVAALQAELRRWAAEPVSVARVLRDLETFERTSLPSDARRLAADLQSLGVSTSDERRQLAERLDDDYRNANVRIALSEELLNKLIPERNLEYAQVNDSVLGRPVHGESLMATEVALRMQPNPSRVRLVLEVAGEIASETTADAGPAQLHNDSESYYVARKPLEIDMDGIRTWPVEVDVENQTRLTGVETSLDGIPLISGMARVVAKSQSEQSKSAASEEVKQKVAAQARQRVEDEVRQGLNEVVEKMNQRVFGPLNSLSLDPQMIEAVTTERRTTMRLRLAGEDQLGSHTPRPQAPGDSLASAQIHESALNNGIQRLQLEGRTFTLPELSEHVAARLGRQKAWEINPECEDVRITFADKDAVVVRCQEGRIIVTLSIVQLAKGSRKWKNFRVQGFYHPEVNGRSAQLVRQGPIYLKGERLNTGAQLVLRGIFSRALSKNNIWELMPERVVKEPKLAATAITQFVIDDGWIGVALGPKRPVDLNARRPHWGLW
ncbi:MAG: hypothetical protein ABFC77_00120 [Thermoguttaceae bacterium]